MILPGETKTFTFFFKSLHAGIFREYWEFGTHPTLLGGATLQVNLYAVSLTQDIFREERKLLKVRDPGPWPRGHQRGSPGLLGAAFGNPLSPSPRGECFTDKQLVLLNNTHSPELCDVKGGWHRE